MEIDDFKAATKEVAAFLVALRRIMPRRVDQELIDYLKKLPDDPVGLEMLRNTLALSDAPK